VNPAPDATRVVLLGASNLTRGCHTVLQIVEQLVGGEADILAAWGRGRSYGKWSKFLLRALPGITECGLWPALTERPSGRCLGLITDIGNDLLYGAEVAEIAAWVETCLVRLQQVQARTVLTMLPISNVANLSPARFDFFKNLFFPQHAATLPDLTEKVFSLDTLLRDLGRKYNAAVVEQESHWYGLDPIHLKMSRWRPAWESILSRWNIDSRHLRKPRRSLTRWLRLHALPQAERSYRGRFQRHSQPCWRWRKTMSLSLY